MNQFDFIRMVLNFYLLFYLFSAPGGCDAAIDCNGHGTCQVNNTCHCFDRFVGSDCSSKH